MQLLSRPLQVCIKYGVDRVAAFVLLVFLSPLAAVIALLIRLDSRGPVFYCQERVGLGGRCFKLFKFRSLVDNADELLDERGRARCDRTTRVGRVLRLCSLDELAQLINIVRGEMSFIGPRPAIPELYERCSPVQRRRCEMRPGITGLAQVSGRNTIPWSRRLELDVQYVDQYSWWLDLSILVRTVWAVCTGFGVVLDRNPDQVDDLGKRYAESQDGTQCSFSFDSFRRIEPRLLSRYRKDPDYEGFLSALNHALAAEHDRQLRELPENFSTIQIVGVPRSGTTLLNQLIGACLDVGYINNLIAAFWRVPCYGIRLSEQLLQGTHPECYRSEYGRTVAICEPHEFGYFWSYMLGYADMVEQADDCESRIDWDRLKKSLTNITCEFNKPVVFKSVLLNWHIGRLQRLLPKTVFVWMHRNPLDNAMSLLDARQTQFGEMESWFSAKPREYVKLRHESVPRQLAGQVFCIEQSIARQMRQIDSSNVLHVSYDQMCWQPQSVVDGVRALLRRNGQEVGLINEPPASFNLSSDRYADHPLYADVEAAVRQFFENDGRQSSQSALA